MKQIFKFHCKDMEPFVTNNTNDFNEDLLDQEHKEQPDFTMERLLFYDGFLKGFYIVASRTRTYLRSALGNWLLITQYW